jgi:hypothetical protein
MLTIVRTNDGDLIVGGQKIGEPNYAMASNGVIHEIGGVITASSATSIGTATIAATLRDDSDFITLANAFSTLKNPVGGESLADELAAAGPFTAGGGDFMLTRPARCCRVCLSLVRAIIMSNDTSGRDPAYYNAIDVLTSSAAAAVRFRRPSFAVFVPDDEYLVDFVAKSGTTVEAFLASSDSWAILANHVVSG